MTPVATAQTVEEVQRWVASHDRVSVVGGGTKPVLSAGANLSVREVAGVVEYEPGEYTITARAGTLIRDLNDILAQNGQFLPFDPVLAEAGATVGGTIASGLSGSGRFRYGGVRDFLLGVRLVNGDGQVVRGGGKVVKNAAGFDIPRLTVGSLGRYGVLVEATFKVFPRPETYTTLRVEYQRLAQALADLDRVALSPVEAACLDLVAPNVLLVRVGGMAAARMTHLQGVRALVSGNAATVEGEQERDVWREAREFLWVPEGHALVKVPIVPSLIPALEDDWEPIGVPHRRYGVGGHLLWLAWPPSVPWARLEEILQRRQRTAVIVRGTSPCPLRPLPAPDAFARRLLAVFDPRGKFASALEAREERGAARGA